MRPVMGVEFHAGEARAHARRHEPEEVARAHGGLEHGAAVEAQALDGAPHRLYDLPRGVMSVLRGAPRRGVFVVGEQPLSSSNSAAQCLFFSSKACGMPPHPT
jgi:hypothetical protein